MKLWLNIWYCAMAGGLFLFAALTVTVGFGAFRDVHMMLKDLLRKHNQPTNQQPPPSPPPPHAG